MKDLTQGSVLSHALAMAVPIFAGLILVLLCGLIDLYFVAGLGEAAIAGIGAAGNAGFVTNALTQIVSVARSRRYHKLSAAGIGPTQI